MPDKTLRGRFVWHELMVSHIAQAHHFYGRVIGWKTQTSEHASDSQLFVGAAGPLGATIEHSHGPAHWLPFIGTSDIDTTLGDAIQLGAKVVKPLTATANGAGQWATLRDPQGASFGVYASSWPHAREKQPKRGEFSWHELATSDYPAAFEFYSALFGWEAAGEADMGPLGTYFMFGRNGTAIGGMFTKPVPMKGDPSWCGYIRVKDLSQALSRAKAAGAAVIYGPSEVPGGDWVAQLTDSQGAMFALHMLKVDVEASVSRESASAPEQGSLDFWSSPPDGQVSAPAAKPSSTSTPAVPKKKDARRQQRARSEPVRSKPAKRAPQKKVKATPSKKPAAKKQKMKHAPASKKVTTRRPTKAASRKVGKSVARKPQARSKLRRAK